MNQSDIKRPEHQAIYQQIRSMILFGSLVPGEAVTIQGLSEKTSAGMTPVREAIRRLIAENALASGRNRRVYVPPMTATTLDQISFARLSIEPRLAFMAAERLGKRQIDDLEVHDHAVNKAISSGDIEAYLETNYQFHFGIYDQADAHVLNRIATSLWLQVGPSLRIVCGRCGTANLPDMHRQTLSALRRNDALGASEAIAEDIRQGLELVRQSLPQ